MRHTHSPRTSENLGEKWYPCWLELPRLYPESQIIKADDGHYYCLDCYRFRFSKDAPNDYIPEITDNLD